MRILIVRHGDPDYENDSLTPKGWREAELLADRLKKLDITKFYCSPMGRARDTASLTLKAMGRETEVLPWLREFKPKIRRPDQQQRKIAWDWLPQDWMIDERFYQKEHWFEHEVMEEAGVRPVYEEICSKLDDLLAAHGYVREGRWYRAAQPNQDTIVLFCHFGLECVLLSHLLNVSPMPLWHGTCAPPTSVTTIRTEERREGIASMRMSNFGDTSHLYAAGEPEAFAARFCECFSNTEERHD